MDIPKEFGGRFVIESELEKRANCVVYKARDRSLGDREVAVKVFVDRPGGNAKWIAAFEEELKPLRTASHRCLVPINSGGCEQDWVYLAMELIPGPTLRRVLEEEGGPLPAEKAVEVAVNLAQALKEIHENKVVHGHLDSRAVMLKGEEVRFAGYCPSVIDEMQKGMTTGGRQTVEPAYIAPEQISNPDAIDARADIYALSVLLFEMTTGTRPFNSANPLQMAMLRLTQEAPSAAKLNPALSPLLNAAIAKGLAREPANRFADIKEFLDALMAAKKSQKNPLAGAALADQPERLATETIPVSMSTEKIQDLLRRHEAPAAQEKKSAQGDIGATRMDMFVARQSLRMNGDETMMTFEASDFLIGSFIVMEGPGQGERRAFTKPQMLIGSDAGCDICFNVKGLPSRYAIVVKRDERYFVGPLSPAGITINNETLTSADEVELQRGDTLSVAGLKLRYIAPGEVFTLHDNVADRVVDRPKSRLNAILAALVVILLVIGGFVLFSFQRGVSNKQLAERRRAANIEQQKKETVARLRQEGDELLKAGHLVEPVDASARKRFEQILEIDPDDTYAKRRLAEIDQRIQALAKQEEVRRDLAQRIAGLLDDAQRYFDAGNYISPPGANAKEVYNSVLRLDPENKTALAKIAEIDTILGSLVARIRVLMDKARMFQDAGQFVAPAGENAFEMVKQALAIDPGNEEAKNMVLDMAAKSIYDGDLAKAKADAGGMRRFYMQAQALGVDPQYLTPRMQGAELIQRSRADVIIYDRGAPIASKDGKGADKDKKKEASPFLDTSEIERRIGILKLKGEGAGGERFIEVQRRK